MNSPYTEITVPPSTPIISIRSGLLLFVSALVFLFIIISDITDFYLILFGIVGLLFSLIISAWLLHDPLRGLLLYFVLFFNFPRAIFKLNFIMYGIFAAVLFLPIIGLFSHRLKERFKNIKIPREFVISIIFLLIIFFISSWHRVFDLDNFFRPGYFEGGMHVNRSFYIVFAIGILLGYSALKFINSRQRLDMLIMIIIAGGLFQAFTGYVQYFGDFRILGTVRSLPEFFASDKQLTTMAFTSAPGGTTNLLISCCLALFFYLTPFNKKPDKKVLIAGLLILYAIILSFVRTTYIAFFVAFGLFIILTIRPTWIHIKKILMVMLFILTFVIIILFTTDFYEHITATRFADAANLIGRIYGWKVAFSNYDQWLWLGGGLGSSKSLITEYALGESFIGLKLSNRSIHSYYLAWAMDTGIPGIIWSAAIILLTIRYFLRTRKFIRDGSSNNWAHYGNIILPTYIAILTEFLTSSHFGTDLIIFFFALSLLIYKRAEKFESSRLAA